MSSVSAESHIVLGGKYCMCVGMYVCQYVCMCVGMYVCRYVCVSVCMCVGMYVCQYVCVSVCMCVMVVVPSVFGNSDIVIVIL